MWPTEDSKSKGDRMSEAGPRFLVGMDSRPVRYPMSDEVFEEFRRRLLDAPGREIVSVSRVNGDVVRIVQRGSGHTTTSVMKLIGDLVVEFSIGNAIAIEPGQK